MSFNSSNFFFLLPANKMQLGENKKPKESKSGTTGITLNLILIYTEPNMWNKGGKMDFCFHVGKSTSVFCYVGTLFS